MATSTRKLILDNVKTTLEALVTYDGLTPVVEFAAKGFDDIEIPSTPWLGVILQNEDSKHLPFGHIEVTQTYAIIGYVEGDTQDLRSSRISDFYDDMLAKLQEDTTRGNNGVVTTLFLTATDESDDDASMVHTPMGTMVVSMRIKYFRTIFDT